MNEEMPFIDKVNSEIDRRKLDRLVDDGVVSADDIANTPIYFMCECGQQQAVENDICISCGRDIS